jgi:hypothetical protein
MKTLTRSELIVTTALGCLSGLSNYGLHRKWERLGLSAYLDAHTKTYQKLYANPVTAIHELVLWTIVAFSGYAIFKALSLGLAGLLDLVYHTKSTTELGADRR